MAAFNGDNLIAAEVLRLRDKHDLKLAVETGTYHGDTTEWLARHFEFVHSIECNRSYLDIARTKLVGLPYMLWLGNSPEILKKILPTIPGAFLLFADAHWNEYWPILDELQAVAACARRDVVTVIHDFHVPGTDLGFDEYNGQHLDLAYVTPGLGAIYGVGGWRHHYNTEAEGSRRGVCYIEPA